MCFLQALRDEGNDNDDFSFEINVVKGKPGKPVSPSKASKEPEKTAEKEEEQVPEEVALMDDSGNNNNNSSLIDEDELIIKDELDNDCFEEVDRIGEIEKEVNETSISTRAFH